MDDPADRLLQALPPLLEARLRRLGQLWEVDPAALIERVLERGLYECEAELRARFTPTEADAWRAALVALQRQPDDPGFARIGRTPALRTPSGDSAVAGPVSDGTTGIRIAEPAATQRAGARLPKCGTQAAGR